MILPKSVSQYLSEKHKQIRNDYRDIEGKYSEQCGHIALDIAKLLLESEYKPYIMEAKQEVQDDDFLKVIPLVPKIYKGRVKWSAHQVCCCNKLAFDPVIGKPVKISEYTKEIFGEKIPMEVVIPFGRIEEFIERFRSN